MPAFDPVSAIFGVAEKVLERVWPDPTQKAQALQAMAELKQKGELAFLEADLQVISGQLEINKMEAQHGGLFKGGWRPAIGWTCAIALAYHFVIQPFLVAIVSMLSFFLGGEEAVFPLALLPRLDMVTIMGLVTSLLGIGGMRTYEKRKTQQSVSK